MSNDNVKMSLQQEADQWLRDEPLHEAEEINKSDGISEQEKERGPRKLHLINTAQSYAVSSPKQRNISRLEKISERPIARIATKSLAKNAPKRKKLKQERPIWELIAEIGEQIPKEEWQKVPTDLARNIDHYLYNKNKAD